MAPGWSGADPGPLDDKKEKEKVAKTPLHIRGKLFQRRA